MSQALTTNTHALTPEARAALDAGDIDALTALNRAKYGGWLMEEGAGDGSEGDEGEGDGDGDDGTGDGDNDSEGEDGDNDGDGEDNDKQSKRASRQAAKYRTQLREAERQRDETQKVLDGLRKAIAGDEGDGEADATELTGQVETLTSRTQQLQAELLVHTLASTHQANPVALLDSRTFTDALHGLDPAEDDYRDQVARAIKTAVSKNAAYKAGQGSSRGGSELDSDRREKNSKRAKGLGAAVGGHYGGK